MIGPSSCSRILVDEAGGIVSGCFEAATSSYNTMHLIVTVDWTIYFVIGYVLGVLINTPNYDVTTSRRKITSTRNIGNRQ